ncbi:MAG: outer membrane beta-barrel domain-containing protein [Bdellovibrio sp.]|nr:outer membrane beta-barrel domain-containing protein [Bdellovibrio sp.]
MRFFKLIALSIIFFTNVNISAGEAKSSKQQIVLAEATTPEKVNVDVIKEKYWARGNETEMGVVQNRLYSKSHKLEVGFFGGITTSDPFLNTKNIGGSVGLHLSEYFAMKVFGWKSFVSPSSALTTFEDTIGATTNNNPPKYYFGTEGSASVLYGKLSLVGKAIIYYDFHLLGGAGFTGTESGTYLTPHLGLGQNVYISQSISIRVDYRLQYYREKIIEKVITPKIGQIVGERTNWSNVVTFGVHFLFGGGE